MHRKMTAILVSLTMASWLCGCGAGGTSAAETTSEAVQAEENGNEDTSSTEASSDTAESGEESADGDSVSSESTASGEDSANADSSQDNNGTTDESTSDSVSGENGDGGTPPDGAPGENGDGSGGPGGTPPDGAPGENGDGSGGPGGTPPDGAPGGNGGPGGTPPDGAPGEGGAPGGNGGPGGSGSSTADGQLGSWSMGGTEDYAYDAALYVTAEGISEEKSATDRISGGTYDAESAQGITITDSASGDTGVLIYNTDYTITDAVIDMLTEADGTDTCDFSGVGSAVAAFGSDTSLLIDGANIHTAGVATMPIFADDGAVVTIQNSVLQSDGGTLHKDYLNTPSQTVMVAPPWILGIMGTSRASNLMGTNTVMNVLDSETSAGAWAVLSTDAGSNMALNIYNTSLTLNNADESAVPFQAEGGQVTTKDNPYTTNFGTGYGTYAIGNVAETFAGATLNVGTYATIFTGGSAVYTALEAGETYDLLSAAGESTGTYTAAENKFTVITSDTFGFMVHQNENTLTIEKGTEVETGFDTFLIKSGASNESVSATIDDAFISNGGMLIQVMDNDDATNGGMMDTDDEANTNGGSQNFKPVHTEDAGFDTSAVTADGSVQEFTFTNGYYLGNVYNASGSDGLSATALKVSFGEGAEFGGAAAMTSAIHVTYEGAMQLRDTGCCAFADAAEAEAFAADYQNTSFTISEYYDMGHVANLVSDNGGNTVEICLTDDAVWNVTGTSCISALTIEDDASVVIPADVTLTVGGQTYTNTTLTADSF